jgi:Flp pilus assembly protein TadD
MNTSDNIFVDCPTQIAHLIAEAIEHHQARRFREAVEHYSRIVQVRPDYGEAWRLLGVVALQTGDNDAARSLLERAIRIDGQDSAAYSALGGVNECAGELDAAYAAYARACAIDATQEAAVVGLTRVALTLGRAAEASALGEATIARGIRSACLFRALGAARMTLEDNAGAAEAFLAALQIEPHPDAYANLGAAYLRLRRVHEAIAACDAAIPLDPLHTEATNILGSSRAIRAAYPQR